MVLDFTLKKYTELIGALLKRDYQFYHLRDIIKQDGNIAEQIIILRHDVDRLPKNSLLMAQVEKSFGIKGTYYFRIVPESYDLKIMEKISGLGHEIGYHYEDVDVVIRNYKLRIRNEEDYQKLIDLAYENFCKNLEMFRKNFDIKTVCMHGSPRSKYDNKIIWSKYNYKELGIIGEPYFDIDFNEFAYFTDTGRRWNGNKVSIRDKVNSKYNFNFKSTKQIIENIDHLPPKLMFTIHPERWDACPVKWSDFLFHGDKTLPWIKNLIWQNVKNIVKKTIVGYKK